MKVTADPHRPLLWPLRLAVPQRLRGLLHQLRTTPHDPADPVEPDEIVTWGDLLADLIYTAHTTGLDALILRLEALADEYAQVPLPDQS